MATEAQREAGMAIAEAASEWVVRLQGASVSMADQTAFLAWLRESPVHVREFLHAEGVFLALENAGRADMRDVEAMLRETPRNVVTLAREELPGFPPEGQRSSEEGAVLEEDTAQDMPTPQVLSDLESRPTSRVHMRKVLPLTVGALAATLVLALTLPFLAPLFERLSPNVYATATGEQRRIALADGSFVDLNTRSKIRVAYTPEQRDIYLEEGEAFFNVTRDSERPFRVLSDTAAVQALGTQFNVYRTKKGTQVAVVEGRVSVRKIAPEPASGGESEAPGVALDAGGFVEVTPIRIVQATLPEPARTVAWRQRRLIFENETLAAVAAEFNRYNRTQIIIRDEALAGERINGVFDADKPQNLIDFLGRHERVHISKESGRHLLITSVTDENP